MEKVKKSMDLSCRAEETKGTTERLYERQETGRGDAAHGPGDRGGLAVKSAADGRFCFATTVLTGMPKPVAYPQMQLRPSALDGRWAMGIKATNG